MPFWIVLISPFVANEGQMPLLLLYTVIMPSVSSPQFVCPTQGNSHQQLTPSEYPCTDPNGGADHNARRVGTQEEPTIPLQHRSAEAAQTVTEAHSKRLV